MLRAIQGGAAKPRSPYTESELDRFRDDATAHMGAGSPMEVDPRDVLRLVAQARASREAGRKAAETALGFAGWLAVTCGVALIAGLPIGLLIRSAVWVAGL